MASYERENASASFQPEGRRKMSQTESIVRMDAEGRLHRVGPDGAFEPVEVPPVPPMGEAEIVASAAADADNPPITPEDVARLRRVPRTKTLRRALRLTQEEFAARYHIPLGTLRDWEQGRTEPDQPARAYLRVIANDPEGTRRALEKPKG
ncbi:helix-turn-helix domain-containing protein [Desulfolutivibrio sulfoxidireducens]|uniref:helix-turn-helix domain-containing protein n=2 Tax=Desulfolutivibrio sulfoxidireducens TaxID=2773299 RepID=UPI001C4010D3|nr:helix-turn-helix domain-containing protein [Desulfolutivibrio sulfoxidireducens]